MALAHKYLDLLPQILVDGSFAASLKEFNPQVQPGSRGGVPGDPALRGSEEEVPLFDSNFELKVTLALDQAKGECVAVYATEEVGFCGDACAEVGGMGGHLVDGVASDLSQMNVSNLY